MSKIIVEFIPPTKWREQPKWRLVEPYTSANGEITVPAGFITDGASIPRIFHVWFSPTGSYFGAAIVHDYILVTEWAWLKANEQFLQELDALGVPSWRKKSILGSVRMYARWLRLLGKD